MLEIKTVSNCDLLKKMLWLKQSKKLHEALDYTSVNKFAKLMKFQICATTI